MQLIQSYSTRDQRHEMRILDANKRDRKGNLLCVVTRVEYGNSQVWAVDLTLEEAYDFAATEMDFFKDYLGLDYYPVP